MKMGLQDLDRTVNPIGGFRIPREGALPYCGTPTYLPRGLRLMSITIQCDRCPEFRLEWLHGEHLRSDRSPLLASLGSEHPVRDIWRLSFQHSRTHAKHGHFVSVDRTWTDGK